MDVHTHWESDRQAEKQRPKGTQMRNATSITAEEEHPLLLIKRVSKI